MENLIQQIKKEMIRWYRVNPSDGLIQQFIDKHNVECFDTLERETFINELALRETGMEWPMNGDSEEYKNKFYKLWTK